MPSPGQISLANQGVLFLDELPGFRHRVLEVMRQPMEDRVVTISRTKTTMTFPANFMLVGAMNPCPCGYFDRSAANWKFLQKVVELILSLQGDRQPEE